MLRRAGASPRRSQGLATRDLRPRGHSARPRGTSARYPCAVEAASMPASKTCRSSTASNLEALWTSDRRPSSELTALPGARAALEYALDDAVRRNARVRVVFAFEE